jgi:hypothetical protein
MKEIKKLKMMALSLRKDSGRRRWKMRRKILILLGLMILLLSPTLASSDCVDLGGSTSWYVRDGHTIIFYEGMTPLALLDISGCIVSSSSNIHLLKNYVCDNDKIIIDGEECSIMTVSSASTGSY